ncbi:MAG: PHP domain-containing protein [Spirochaetales bacterium]|nr:PHP domain-containing protein [Spirochaetales bacterium]
MIDLHTHSEHSDGTFSVRKIIETAKNLQMTAISITDHDSISSQKEAISIARELRQDYITGIEFSIDFRNPNGVFHLLGYGINEDNTEISRICKLIQEERFERNRSVLRKLKAAGYIINYQEIVEKFNTSAPGRPHIAAMMKEKGYVKSIYEAFDRFLGDGKSFHIEKNNIDLETACSSIINAGGVPIIAHPISLRLNREDFSNFLLDAKEKGVVGLEAINSGFKNRNCRKFLKAHSEVIEKTQMIFTAGSDFHGSNKPGIKIGRDSAGTKISDTFLPDTIKKLKIRLD